MWTPCHLVCTLTPCLAVALGWLLSVGPRVASAADAAPTAEPAKAVPADARSNPDASADASPAADLQRIQGTWERQLHAEERDHVSYRRVVKKIEGNRETVTYYTEDGKVERAHRVEFRLERFGPVRVFTYFNLERLEGPDKGKTFPEAKSYIYRLTNDTLDEVWGFLPGQEKRAVSYYIHRRVRDGKDAAVTAGSVTPGSGSEGKTEKKDEK